jgi:hypothetical protein
VEAKILCHMALKSSALASPRIMRMSASWCCGLTTLEDIEKAVAELPADQLARFRAWLEEFEAARSDERIERRQSGQVPSRTAAALRSRPSLRMPR